MDSVKMASFAVFLGFLETLFMNFQALIGPDSPYSVGLFNYTTSEVSAMYPTPVTPAGYTFSIWSLIYLWNLAWIVYHLTTLYRKNAGGPVYLNPPVTSTGFLVVYFINNQLNILWLFLWDRQVFPQAVAGLILIGVSLYVAIGISLKRAFDYLDVFKKIAESDLWAYRVLVQNGLAIYASWATVAAQVNLSVLLVYTFGLSGDLTTYITLTNLAIILIIVFVFDLFAFDQYTRYVFMVYPTFVWSLAGVAVANSGDTSGVAFIYTVILASVAFIFFVVKTVFMIIREPVYLTVKKAMVQASIYKPSSILPYYQPLKN